MILVNMGHPVNESQLAEVRAHFGEDVKEIPVNSYLDINQPFTNQIIERVSKVVNSLPLDERIAIVPPSLSHAAVLVVMEFFGQIGRMPEIVRWKKVSNNPPRYGLAEVIQLETFRVRARSRRE